MSKLNNKCLEVSATYMPKCISATSFGGCVEVRTTSVVKVHGGVDVAIRVPIPRQTFTCGQMTYVLPSNLRATCCPCRESTKMAFQEERESECLGMLLLSHDRTDTWGAGNVIKNFVRGETRGGLCCEVQDASHKKECVSRCAWKHYFLTNKGAHALNGNTEAREYRNVNAPACHILEVGDDPSANSFSRWLSTTDNTMADWGFVEPGGQPLAQGAAGPLCLYRYYVQASGKANALVPVNSFIARNVAPVVTCYGYVAQRTYLEQATIRDSKALEGLGLTREQCTGLYNTVAGWTEPNQENTYVFSRLWALFYSVSLHGAPAVAPDAEPLTAMPLVPPADRGAWAFAACQSVANGDNGTMLVDGAGAPELTHNMEWALRISGLPSFGYAAGVNHLAQVYNSPFRLRIVNSRSPAAAVALALTPQTVLQAIGWLRSSLRDEYGCSRGMVLASSLLHFADGTSTNVPCPSGFRLNVDNQERALLELFYAVSRSIGRPAWMGAVLENMLAVVGPVGADGDVVGEVLADIPLVWHQEVQQLSAYAARYSSFESWVASMSNHHISCAIQILTNHHEWVAALREGALMVAALRVERAPLHIYLPNVTPAIGLVGQLFLSQSCGLGYLRRMLGLDAHQREAAFGSVALAPPNHCLRKMVTVAHVVRAMFDSMAYSLGVTPNRISPSIPRDFAELRSFEELAELQERCLWGCDDHLLLESALSIVPYLAGCSPQTVRFQASGVNIHLCTPELLDRIPSALPRRVLHVWTDMTCDIRPNLKKVKLAPKWWDTKQPVLPWERCDEVSCSSSDLVAVLQEQAYIAGGRVLFSATVDSSGIGANARYVAAMPDYSRVRHCDELLRMPHEVEVGSTCYVPSFSGRIEPTGIEHVPSYRDRVPMNNRWALGNQGFGLPVFGAGAAAMGIGLNGSMQVVYTAHGQAAVVLTQLAARVGVREICFWACQMLGQICGHNQAAESRIEAASCILTCGTKGRNDAPDGAATPSGPRRRLRVCAPCKSDAGNKSSSVAQAGTTAVAPAKDVPAKPPDIEQKAGGLDPQ